MYEGNHYTIDDLVAIPDEWNRYELIDGRMYVSDAPHYEHQHVVSNSCNAFSDWGDDYEHGLTVPGVGVVFSHVAALAWLRRHGG